MSARSLMMTAASSGRARPTSESAISRNAALEPVLWRSWMTLAPPARRAGATALSQHQAAQAAHYDIDDGLQKGDAEVQWGTSDRCRQPAAVTFFFDKKAFHESGAEAPGHEIRIRQDLQVQGNGGLDPFD